MQLGKVIRELREPRGWIQEELAFRCGTTAANVSRIETSKHGPGTELLQAIAHAFGMRVHQLNALAEGGEAARLPTQYSRDEIKLIANFRKMSPARRRLLLQTVAVYVGSEGPQRKARKAKI